MLQRAWRSLHREGRRDCIPARDHWGFDKFPREIRNDARHDDRCPAPKIVKDNVNGLIVAVRQNRRGPTCSRMFNSHAMNPTEPGFKRNHGDSFQDREPFWRAKFMFDEEKLMSKETPESDPRSGPMRVQTNKRISRGRAILRRSSGTAIPSRTSKNGTNPTRIREAKWR